LGNAAAFIYSLFGAVFALLFMIIFYKLSVFSQIGVSVIGGVLHNVGQIVAAAIVMENFAIAVYLPPLAIVGTVAGVAVGIAAGLLVSRIGKRLGK
jgi:heptaprenyl diphosphate synthase